MTPLVCILVAVVLDLSAHSAHRRGLPLGLVGRLVLSLWAWYVASAVICAVTGHWGSSAFFLALLLWSLFGGWIGRKGRRIAKLIGAKARAARQRLVDSMPGAHTPSLA